LNIGVPFPQTLNTLLSALAMATLIAKDKTIEEAENLTEEDLEKEFEFPERRKNYPKSAIMALQQAIKDFKEGAGVPKEKRITGTKALELLKTNGTLSHEDLSSVILELPRSHIQRCHYPSKRRASTSSR